MKMFLIILSLLTVLSSHFARGQASQWDIGLTEILIHHNEKNYGDHKHSKTKQETSGATVNLWQRSTRKFKALSDSIDKRLTSVYIITADAAMIYQFYYVMQDIVHYQKESMNIAYKYPFTISTIIEAEKGVFQNAKDLSLFTAMVVASYGDVSKMKTSSRKLVYGEVIKRLNNLSFQCFQLYSLLSMVASAEEMKKAKIPGMINRDKQVANDILNNFKF